MRPETGAPMILETGIAIMKNAIIFACSRRRNQYDRYSRMPGK
jgi:hypothetical protein